MTDKTAVLAYLNYPGNPLGKTKGEGLNGVDSMYPPLGLDYLISNYPKPERVYAVDAVIENLSAKETSSKILNHCPDLVGMGCTYINLHEALKISRNLKEENPGISTVIGGPGAISLTAIYAGNSIPCVDYCVTGDGEEIFQRLMDCAHPNKDTQYFDGYVDNLDLLQFPKRAKFDVERYFRANRQVNHLRGGPENRKILNIESSRGCRGKCLYCTSGAKRRFRGRTAAHIGPELDYIKEKFHPDALLVVDDSFACDAYRAKEVSREFGRRDMKWFTQARADDLVKKIDGRKVIEYMGQNGCKEVFIGIESGSQNVLNQYSRGMKLETIEEALISCKNSGVCPSLFFMYGFPGETLSDLEKTKRLAEKLIKCYDPPTVWFSRFTSIPGSKAYGLGLMGRLKSKEICLFEGWLEGMSEKGENIVFNRFE